MKKDLEQLKYKSKATVQKTRSEPFDIDDPYQQDHEFDTLVNKY